MSQQDVYVDVSVEFDRAVNDIPNGQTAAFSMFKLADAVSTFEIGDPNFDSETSHAQHAHVIYDTTRSLTPAEAIEAMYHILRLQSTWIAGCPMSQSIFTSHYIHNLLEYHDDARNIEVIQFRRGIRSNRQNGPLNILRCYCILTIKVIWGVNNLLKHSRIPSFEEGEHIWQTHGKGLFSHIDMQTIQNEFSQGVIDTAVNMHMSGFEEAAKALIFLQWDFLLALSNPAKLGENYCFQWVPGYLKIIHKHLERFDDEGNRCMKDAVNANLCEKYPPLIPPRQITPHKIDEISETFNQIKNECEGIIQDVLEGQLADPTNVLSLKQYLYFKNLEHCRADLFIRTFSYSMISTQNEGIWTDRILNEIWQTTFYHHSAFSPSGVDVDEHPVQKEIFRRQVMEFVESVRRSDTFMILYQALFVNRSRMRREFVRVIKGLEAFKKTARDFDVQLLRICEGVADWASYPTALFDWVHLNQLWVSQCVLELGFELRIYDYDEYRHILCYLCEIVTTRESLMGRYFTSVMDNSWYHQSGVMLNLDPPWVRNLFYYDCRSEVYIYDHIAALWQNLYKPEERDTLDFAEQRWSLRMKPFRVFTEPSSSFLSRFDRARIPDVVSNRLLEDGRTFAKMCTLFPRSMMKQWDIEQKRFPLCEVNFRAEKVFSDIDKLDYADGIQG